MLKNLISFSMLDFFALRLITGNKEGRDAVRPGKKINIRLSENKADCFIFIVV